MAEWADGGASLSKAGETGQFRKRAARPVFAGPEQRLFYDRGDLDP